MLTMERVREVAIYDPKTGLFRWRIARKNCVADTIIGNRAINDGYGMIGIDGTFYLTHRLAWFYIHGTWPNQIDHINTDKMDNRIANLREATKQQNARNRSITKVSRSGYKGVFWHKRIQKWQAAVGHNGKNVHIGYFDSAEEAHSARSKRAKELHGEFARFA